MARPSAALAGGWGSDLLIVSWEQTAGRGRRGRRWASSAGAGIYASLVLELPSEAHLSVLPLLAPVTLSRRLELSTGLPCRIKWPNDLTVEGGKIGGLLLESLPSANGTGRRAIVGFGINYLPATGVDGALSLSERLAEPPDLAELTVDLALGLLRERHRLDDTSYVVEAYRSLTVHRPGDQIRYRTGAGIRSGVFHGFDRRGFLRLDDEGGERLLAAAELVE